MISLDIGEAAVKIPVLGSGVGVWWAILIVNIIQRLAQKLRRIILPHLGLVALRVQFRKTKKTSCSWISNLADATMTPQTNYI